MTNELSVLLLKAAAGVYILAALCYIAHFITGRKPLGHKFGPGLLILGLMPHIASLVIRSIVAQRPPFLNLYEYVASLTLGLVVVYLVVELLTKTRSFGVFVAPLIALAAVYGIMLPNAVTPTMPALKSAWRVPHVATAILAYSSFAIASALAVLYMIKERAGESGKGFWSPRLPDLKVLDHTAYRLIAFGFLMQTALLLTGAVWAQYAFGRPWSWDPKEDWALITWLVYAAYLHTRLSLGWKGRKSIMLAGMGFAIVIFTLFGVNLLGRGYHSYYR